MSLGSHSPEEEVGGQLQKDTIAKIQLKDTIERYNCGAPQHEGRCQKPLTLFGAGYLLPPSRQGAGVGATFAPMSLFNNKTQNILALMHVFIVSCS